MEQALAFLEFLVSPRAGARAEGEAGQEMKEMNRCLIYLRVSSREQAEEGYSIAAQREACLRLIEERGWTFVDEYHDAGALGPSSRTRHIKIWSGPELRRRETLKRCPTRAGQ